MMLELLRNLASGPALRYPVVMAFVAGEEDDLLGAAAFVESDPLMPEITAFIDFDSTPGNKAMLFLSTGTWLDQVYAAKAPRPFGTILQNDVLNSGAISSITDWTVFSQNGRLPGLGFGFANLRQFYHTTDDNLRRFLLGSLQQYGDNTLALVAAAASAPELAESPHVTQRVYFDLFNQHMVIYPLSLSAALHTLLAVGFVACLALIPFFTRHPVRHPHFNRDVQSDEFVPLDESFVGLARRATPRFIGLRIFFQFGKTLLSFLLALTGTIALLAFCDAVLPPFWFGSSIGNLGFLSAATMATVLIVVDALLIPGVVTLCSRRIKCMEMMAPIDDAESRERLFEVLGDEGASVEQVPVRRKQGPQGDPLLTQFAFNLYGLSAFFALLTIITAPVAYKYGGSYVVFWPCLGVFCALFVHELVYMLISRRPHLLKGLGTPLVASVWISLLNMVAILFPMMVVLNAFIPVFSTLMTDSTSTVLGAVLIGFITALIWLPLLPAVSWVSQTSTAAFRFLLGVVVAILVISFFFAVAVPHPFTTNFPVRLLVAHQVQFSSTSLATSGLPFTASPQMERSQMQFRSLLKAQDLGSVLREQMDIQADCPPKQPGTSYPACTVAVEPPTGLTYPTVEVVAVNSATRNVTLSVDFSGFGTAVLSFSSAKPVAWSFLNKTQPMIELIGGMPSGLNQQTFWIQFASSETVSNFSLVSNFDSDVASPPIQSFVEKMPQSITIEGRGTGLITATYPFTIQWS